MLMETGISRGVRRFLGSKHVVWKAYCPELRTLFGLCHGDSRVGSPKKEVCRPENGHFRGVSRAVGPKKEVCCM